MFHLYPYLSSKSFDTFLLASVNSYSCICHPALSVHACHLFKSLKQKKKKQQNMECPGTRTEYTQNHNKLDVIRKKKHLTDIYQAF